MHKCKKIKKCIMPSLIYNFINILSVTHKTQRKNRNITYNISHILIISVIIAGIKCTILNLIIFVTRKYLYSHYFVNKSEFFILLISYESFIYRY